jgi:transposase
VGRVIIGMDRHKRSATVEIINAREKVLAQGRFGTDRDGYAAMLKLGRQYKDRVWAVEGCNGIGRHIAQRLVADGESVFDVPAKLSARARLFDTAQGRKTDPADAYCIAVAALRAKGLRQVAVDDVTVALKLLVDRRDGLGRARSEVLSRLHHLLLELVPGGAKQFLSATQARALLNTVQPRDIVGRTRRQLASELITEVAVIDKKIKAANERGRRVYRPRARRTVCGHGAAPYASSAPPSTGRIVPVV